MEDDSSSMISSAKTNNNYVIHHHSMIKRPRLEHHHHDQVDTNINIATPSSAKFKGVVPQQNGHWGAQIYANHQRIWLGTFKSEKAAAMAYDSAAIKLRSGDSQRNFPWTSLTIQEPDFQSHHTTETVLSMIKDGSYLSKFEEFVRNRSQSKEDRVIANSVANHDHQYLNKIKGHGDSQLLTRQLFQKELTPSDVGKLNRLVIPKKYAVKYFPYISEDNNNNNNDNNNNNNHVEGNGVEDIELVFYDKKMRPWRFRYCYWRSSQSFVFTRGWNRFVKENNLKANDIITFYACEQCCRPGIAREVINGQSFCLIDVTHNGVNKNVQSDERWNSGSNSNNNEGINNYYHWDKLVEKDWKLGFDHHQGRDQCKNNEEVHVSKSKNVEEKGFRLFGVDIKSWEREK